MGFFNDDNAQRLDQRRNEYQNLNDDEVQAPTPHKASILHEGLAAAASFEAAHLWEKHEEAEGKIVEHGRAKEFLAAAAGAFIDREAETRGLNEYDKIRAKHHAQQQLDQQAREHYGDGYDQ